MFDSIFLLELSAFVAVASSQAKSAESHFFRVFCKPKKLKHLS